MILSNQHILLNDTHLLALNKPQGIMVEEDRWGHENLCQCAKNYLANTSPRKEVFLQNIHRLDRPVSGIVLFAKKPSALKHLQEQFRQKTIQKVYLALTDKHPSESTGELNHFHYKDVRHQKALISSKKLPSYSPVSLLYELLFEKNGIYYWKIKLLTGKYHQIRAQLAHVGCPIIGDELYGSKVAYRPHAIALHAFRLEFTHPKTNKLVSLTASPPDDQLWNPISLTQGN